MKRFFLPLILVLFVCSSCDFLQKKPITSISASNFYKNAHDVKSALNGIYNGLQSFYGQNLYVLEAMPSGNVTSLNTDVTSLDNINFRPTAGNMNGVFDNAYITIDRVNSLLANISHVKMNSKTKTQIIGQAHFVRGLCYFDLVRLFGGVPMMLKPVGSGNLPVNKGRASVDSVYTQIIRDLKVAQKDAPMHPSDPVLARGRATSGAASALLSKVYLYLRDYKDAISEAQKVLNNPLYTFVPNFNDLWPPNNRKGSIFEIEFSPPPGTGESIAGLSLPAPPDNYTFEKYDRPTKKFINDYVDTTNDLRFHFNGKSNVSFINRPGTGPNSGYFIWKWRSPGNSFSSKDNIEVMRLGGIKLVYAEASNELHGPNPKAFKQLNDIRNRAGLSSVSSNDFPTKQALRNQIDRQRRLELAFEGHRWSTLVRYARQEIATGNFNMHKITALTIIKEKTGSKNKDYLLFPIPQKEVLNNKLIKQNPGY